MSKPSTAPPDRSISEADWEQTPASVRAYVLRLLEKGRRNPQNSSQPPPQDSPSQKRSQPKDKTPSEWSRGGQVGHEGKGRSLLPLDAVSEVVIYRPERCQGCGAALVGSDPQPYRYQVTELPPVMAQVVEHQVHRLVCPWCATENRGELPPSVAASQFGPQLASLMAVLMGVYRLSKRQVVQLLADCFQVEMAVGSVVNQQRAVSGALAASVAEVVQYVQQQTVCNVDETRWRQQGQPKTAWLWVAVTRVATVFQVVLSRSQEMAQRLLGPDFAGVVDSDRASSYAWLAVERRQVCWSP